jgi:restriction system protein
MCALIENGLPHDWRQLEEKVGLILREIGYTVETQQRRPLARGRAVIDVWAEDDSTPANQIAIECKHWHEPVKQDVVHSFRTRVIDSGANSGWIVSTSGFQSGAVEAAASTNIKTLTWVEFQELLSERWFRRYFAPTLDRETNALHEYTEPINSRISRKVGELSTASQREFARLRERYGPLATCNFALGPYARIMAPRILPSLPLRNSTAMPDGNQLAGIVPEDVLDAPALRPLLTALLHHSSEATAAFDRLFGERA